MDFKPGVEVITVGGAGGEVGANMSAVRVDDEVFIFDMGLHMPNYIKFTEEDISELTKKNTESLKRAGAIPDDSVIKHWKKSVKGIFVGHAHLDHIGAIPFLGNRYKCPVVGSPYTIQVLKHILRDEKIDLKNKLVTLNPNSKMNVSKKVTLEFVHVTHSVPQAVLMALHTKYGVILYGTDFKFDDSPGLGKGPNYAGLKRLGDKGIILTIVDTLYAHRPGKMPSEAIAREQLKEALLDFDSRGKAVVVTTFSSHMSRLKAIVEYGKKTKRKIVFLGRSLAKYTAAAEEIDLCNFSKHGVEIVKFSRQAKAKLKDITNKGKENYLLVVTGNQGEPKAMLTKMANKQFAWRFHSGDHVLFSSKTIPVEPNLTYRRDLDNLLKHEGVKIFPELHVSGHAAREDIREYLKLTRPQNVIPAHGEPKKIEAFQTLWAEMGKPADKVHILKPGQSLKLV